MRCVPSSKSSPNWASSFKSKVARRASTEPALSTSILSCRAVSFSSKPQNRFSASVVSRFNAESTTARGRETTVTLVDAATAPFW